MPATKKFGIIFQLVDQYTDEDSDVNLLRGVQMPTHGPVFIPAKTAEAEEPSAGLASVVPEPPSFSMEPKPPEQPASSSTAATANPAAGSRGASALTADQVDLVNRNKKAALERRVQLQAEARESSQQRSTCRIFKAQFATSPSTIKTSCVRPFQSIESRRTTFEMLLN